jgi:hypothetical protein
MMDPWYSDAQVANRALGFGTGRQENQPLNDGQIPNVRVVRVRVSTGYTRVEGNRRASRNGRVSSSPTEIPTIRLFPSLYKNSSTN